MIVARALAHALPPGLRMEAVELDQAAAGDQDGHQREAHRVHVVQRQRRDDAFGVGPHAADVADVGIPAADVQEVRVAQDAALRPAGRARGVEQRAFGVDADRLAGARGRRARVGRDAAGAPSSAPCDASGAPQALAAACRSAPRPGSTTARPISLWPSRYSSSAERISALIGTTLAPSALSANQWRQERRPVLEHQADAVAVAVAGCA